MFENMSKAAKLSKAKELFQRAVDADVKWQEEARADFKFRDGDQWTDEEKKILEEELRPVLTMNLTKSSVDLIMGMNEDNRVVHRASPTEPTDAFLADVLNDVSDWVAESNDFEDEEDAALESAVICGRGYVAVDFVPDPKRFGEIEMTEVEVSVHEVHFDPASRRSDLSDASYICWDRWLPLADFKMRFPTIRGKRLAHIIANGTQFGLDTVWDANMPQSAFDIPVETVADDSDYDKPLDMNYYDKSKDMVRLIHMEYWEAFTRYYAWNPEDKSWFELGKQPTAEMKAEYLNQFKTEMVVETVMDKKVKWIQFIGDAILYDGDSPLPYPGFSIVPIFAFGDVSKVTANHFGLVRLMRDPQKEINKRWSQALNMLNQQVQPGVYAETDAFVDAQQAEQSMKEAGAITWTNAGALTGGKIKERTVPNFPQAPMQMEQFSQDIMKKITGINPDLLGQDRGRQEPGVVVRLRQQQGITLLKPLFKSFNKAKKALFKRQLAVIMEYMPDSQIMRILGGNDRYIIDKEKGIIVDQQAQLQANFRDVRNLEYNIKSEEHTGSMSKRMLELTALLEMQGNGFPVDPEQIIDKMQISEREKRRWIEFIQAQQQAQSEQQEQMLQAEMQFKDREIGVKEKANEVNVLLGFLKARQQADKDDKKMAEVFAELQQEDKHALMEFIVEMIKIANDAKLAQTELAQKQVELQHTKVKAAAELQKAQLEGVKAGQDIMHKEISHRQGMQHASEKSRMDLETQKEKNKANLQAQKDKNKVALQKAKQKPAGGTNAGRNKKKP